MIRPASHLHLIRGFRRERFCAGVCAMVVGALVLGCTTRAMAQRAVAPEPSTAQTPQESSQPAEKGTPPAELPHLPSAGAAPKWQQPSMDDGTPAAEEKAFADGPQSCLPPRRRMLDLLRPEQQVPDPRVQQNWLAHPFSAGLFIGSLHSSTLMVDWVNQSTGYVGGVRVGYDFDEYLGLEFRHAFGSCRLVDSDRAIAAAASQGLSETAQARFSDRQLYEITFLWYPIGGGRWQPYIMAGIGIAEVQFLDLLGNDYSASVPSVPVGIGVKYHCTDRVVLRLEGTDDLVFTRGAGMVDTLHDLSILAGIEFRFGGSRRSYWPWVPAGSVW